MGTIAPPCQDLASVISFNSTNTNSSVDTGCGTPGTKGQGPESSSVSGEQPQQLGTKVTSLTKLISSSRF